MLLELSVPGILSTISTVSMIRLGRTYGDLMVEVGASNEELRARARRTVELANELAAAAGGAVRGAVEDA